MADEDEAQQQEEQDAPDAEMSEKKSLIARFLPWIILVVVAVFSAGAGFGLGRIFAGSDEAQRPEPGSKPEETSRQNDLMVDEDQQTSSTEVWYYDLEPVVANLNEPSVTRYVRASLTLEVSSELDEKKGTAFFDKKKPVLINWLYVYLSGLSLEDIRGDKNLKSVQSQIREAFNEELFPDSKPLIEQVLIKEFPVQ